MRLWQEFDWTDWIPLAKIGDFEWTTLGPGVYAIGAGLEDGKPVPIHRVCGCDTDGVIYFGEGTLALRLGFLSNIVDENCDEQGYFATNLFTRMCLNRIFDRRFLRVRWCESAQSRELESRVMDSYVCEFGEVPPGNSQSIVSYF